MNSLQSLKKRTTIQYAMTQILYWSAYGVYCGFIALTFQDRGFTAFQVGVLISFRYLAGAIVQPITGRYADKYPKLPIQRFLGVCFGISVFIVYLLFRIHGGFLITSVLVLLLGLLELNVTSLLAAICVRYIHAGVSMKYSIMRGLGSASYAITCVICGIQIRHFGLESLLLTHIGILVVLTFLVSLLPVTERLKQNGAVSSEEDGEAVSSLGADGQEAAEEVQTEGRSHAMLELLRMNPTFSLMLVGAFFSLCGIMPLSSYMAIIMQDRGGNTDILGYALFMQAMSELPAAFCYNFFERRYHPKYLLVASFFFMSLRGFLTYLAPTTFLVGIVQISQMAGYGVFLYAGVRYAETAIAAEDRVQAIALMNVAGGSLAGFVGSLIMGKAMDLGGINALLISSITLCLIGSVIGVLSLRLSKAEKTVRI